MREWTDTHLHLLYPERLHYDWTQDLPALQGAFRLEDYNAVARSLGITQTLHMEVDVREAQAEQETELVAELVARGDSPLVGAIAACRPEHDRIDAFVERALAHPIIHGFRRVLHVVPDELSVSSTFRSNIRKLTKAGHPFDICMAARQLALAAQLIDACPHSQFVLDHCGVPDIAGNQFSTWKNHMTALAERPNVVCKISGVIAYGDATRWVGDDIAPIVRDLRPYVEHVIACFGWSRVVWGSDHPVCNLSRDLQTWKRVTDELLSACSSSELDALAHGNARRIYRLPSTPLHFASRSQR